MNLTAREGHKLVALEKVEDALPKKVGDDTYMIAKIEAIS